MPLTHIIENTFVFLSLVYFIALVTMPRVNM